MLYDFDRVIDRKNTQSFKWDKNIEYFNREDVIPLWVADMDFPCAEPIVEAIRARASHAIYGYTVRTDKTIDAFLSWSQARHWWLPEKEHLSFCPPGIIYALHELLLLLTEKGDKVILQTPNYDPLFDIVTGSDRELLLNPMILDGGQYRLDIKHFEQLAERGAKLLILSNPNNPTGRVFTKGELLELGNICKKHGMYILSDEIYADFTVGANKHVPLTSLPPEISSHCVSCFSVSKGFNLGGLQTSILVIPDKDLRQRFNRSMGIAQTRLDNVFGTIAMEAAYKDGAEWLDQAIAYVSENGSYVREYLAQTIPLIQPIMPEGTFLMWLDCRKLGMDSKQLEEFLISKAGLALTQGYEFGETGHGFVRINLACPRPTLAEALDRLHQALR